jgi:hypothetical protein
VTAATAFTAGLVSWDGSVDTTTTTTSPSYLFRGLASEDGLYFYASGSQGIKGFAYGAPPGTAQTQLVSTTSASTVGIGFFNGGLYAAWASSTYGVVRPFLSPYPTVAGSTLLSASALSGTASSSINMAGFAFASPSLLYTCQHAASGTTGQLTRYTVSGVTWTRTLAGWPRQNVTWALPGGGTATSIGIKQCMGFFDAASNNQFSLYLVASTGTSGGNAILKYNTITNATTLIATAPTNVNYQAIAPAPFPASISPSPSFGSSASPSRTPTATSTATPTASASPVCAPATASPAPFSYGSVVVLRVGTGPFRGVVTEGVNTAREAFLDEYSPDGGLIQVRCHGATTQSAAVKGVGGRRHRWRCCLRRPGSLAYQPCCRAPPPPPPSALPRRPSRCPRAPRWWTPTARSSPRAVPSTRWPSPAAC